MALKVKKTVAEEEVKVNTKTVKSNGTKGAKASKKVEPVEVEGEKSEAEELLELRTLEDGLEGILGIVDISKSKEVHLRVIEINGKARIDIRTYNSHTKYQGYTQKGISLPMGEIDDLITVLNSIKESYKNGEIEPLKVEFNK